MTKAARARTLILLCSALCACASDDPGEGPRHGPPRALPNIFISPAGEPFRAAQGAPYPVAVWFDRADADHDGRLDREEFRHDALSFFNKLDTNHDGVIDGVELGNYEQNIAPEILPHIEGLHAEEGMDTDLTFGDPSNTDNRPNGRQSHQRSERAPTVARGIGMQGAELYSVINTPEPVAAADARFDGRITRDEFLAAIDRRFDLLDTKSTGYLTLATLPKTPIQAAILKRKKARARARHPDPPVN